MHPEQLKQLTGHPLVPRQYIVQPPQPPHQPLSQPQCLPEGRGEEGLGFGIRLGREGFIRTGQPLIPRHNTLFQAADLPHLPSGFVFGYI